MNKPGLGRGLDALIPQLPPPGGKTVSEIVIDTIKPNPFQPRRQFDDESITELADSIRAHGIVQPIVVRQTDEGFQLIAGERRLRAARAAGFDTIPAIVRHATDSQVVQVALVENLQREDINAMEAAEAYDQLISRFGATQEEVASAVGKSRAAVANTLRLLKLPGQIQQSIRDGKLSEGHARALLTLPNEAEMHIVWRKIEAQGLSVRETEALAKRLTEPRPHSDKVGTATVDPIVLDLEQRLQRALGTKVRIKPKKPGGTIMIEYTSEDDLDRLLQFFETRTTSSSPVLRDM